MNTISRTSERRILTAEPVATRFVMLWAFVYIAVLAFTLCAIEYHINQIDETKSYQGQGPSLSGKSDMRLSPSPENQRWTW